MRILLANDNFPPMYDGVVNTVVNYARILQANHGETMVATPFYPNVEDEYPFSVLRYNSLDTEKLVGYRTGDPFDAAALREIREFQPDVIHSHCPMASMLMARESRELTGAPVILTYHTKFDIDVKRAVKLGVLQDAIIEALVENVSAADEVWAVNRGAGENLKHLGYARDYILMPNGVDLPREAAPEKAQHALDETWGLSREEPLFLFVGRMMWYKGLRITLDGLKGLMERGYSFRMAFVGDGDDMDAVQQYAKDLGVADRCIFPGSIRDRELLRAWYSRADLFLLPSVFDNNPLVVKEAAACGTASVLVEGSSSAEGVTDGVNAILIPEDGTAMTAALERIARDRSLAVRLGKGAARDLYVSWDESIARAARRYEEVLAAKQRGELSPHPAKYDRVFGAYSELFLATEWLGRAGKMTREESLREWKRLIDEIRESYAVESAREKRKAVRQKRDRLLQRYYQFLGRHKDDGSDSERYE